MKKNQWIFAVAMIGMLTALTVICGRFLGINTLFFKFETSFIPILLAAYWYGPIGGMAVSALGDLIGALAFPTGAYNPLFTLSAAISGLLIGFAFKGNYRFIKAVLGVIPKQIICSLVLNSIFISVFYNKDFWPFLLTVRLPQVAVMSVAEITFAHFAVKYLIPKIKSKLLPR